MTFFIYKNGIILTIVLCKRHFFLNMISQTSFQVTQIYLILLMAVWDSIMVYMLWNQVKEGQRGPSCYLGYTYHICSFFNFSYGLIRTTNSLASLIFHCNHPTSSHPCLNSQPIFSIFGGLLRAVREDSKPYWLTPFYSGGFQPQLGSLHCLPRFLSHPHKVYSRPFLPCFKALSPLYLSFWSYGLTSNLQSK